MVSRPWRVNKISFFESFSYSKSRIRCRYGAMEAVELFVHFDDGDPAGIVFFGHYFRMAHRALELSLPQVGLEWKDFFQSATVGFPVRHSEAQYHRPLLPGAPVSVKVIPEKVGESSLTFRYEFRKESSVDSDLLAELRVVHVCVDVKSLKKAPLPEKIKSAFVVS
ncbi:MAG TPA: hypothetical protein DCL41_01845 [Bdellovibrionales bacterium]|nr:hypothetical protein [Pseudobdellovibrionaceae bacterium]HAG90581.1 hypothetical protein [Bdellovibrionales bacterium]